jgi:uncharacterized membrane protein YbhN (UPF0104 family)
MFNKFTKNIFKYLRQIVAALFILGIFAFIINRNDLSQLKNIDPKYIAVIMILIYVTVIIDSIEYNYLLKKVHKKTLDLFDFLTFPLSVNIWGYIVPLQGSLVYTALLFKYKYKSVVSKSITMSLSSYLISFWVSGIFGALLFLFFPHLGINLFILCLILILLPLCLLVNKYILNFRSRIKIAWIRLAKGVDYILSMQVQISEVFDSYKVLVTLATIHTLHIITSLGLYYVIAQALGEDLPLELLLVYTIFIRLSQVIKITPGNLGWNELLSGGIFAVYGLDPSIGFKISIAKVAVNLILSMIIGIGATYYNSKHFNFFSKLLSILNGKKEEKTKNNSIS